MKTGLIYFDKKIEEFVKYSNRIKSLVLERDDFTCKLCETKHPSSSVFAIDDETPTLNNTLCICDTCRVRVIGDNVKRFKLIFANYLRKKEIVDFNNAHGE
jgi:hypothetical protein